MVSLSSSKAFLAATDQYEIQTTILSSKQACDLSANDIKAKPARVVSEVVSMPFAHICNLILSKGVFPDKIKLARVTVNDVNNYRPISAQCACMRYFLRTFVFHDSC